MYIAIEGLPGVGKTTLLNELKVIDNATFIEELCISQQEQRDNDFYILNDIERSRLIKQSNDLFVISDRSYFSTLAYNYAFEKIGLGNEYNNVKNKIMDKIAKNIIVEPDYYFFLEADIETCLRRQKKENIGKLWHNRKFLIALERHYQANLLDNVYRFNTLRTTRDIFNLALNNINQIKKKAE